MSESDNTNSTLIAGAGIGGLTAAIALGQKNVDVTVLEQTDSPRDTGAGIQLGPNALQVLGRLGLLKDLEQSAVKPANATIRAWDTGKQLFQTPLNPAHLKRYGQNYLHIHRADLIEILLSHARQAGANIKFGTKVELVSQQDQQVQVRCNQQETSVDLLIGADGIHSQIRDAIIDCEPPRFTGQTAWRALVPADAISNHRLPVDATVWAGPGKHFVAYYLRKQRLINIVGVVEQQSWTEESWNIVGDIDRFRASFGGWDSTVTSLIDACDSCYFWGLFDRSALRRWSNDRIVLLGDACHPMLPFMAQGAAMAIEDAWVLADLMTDPELDHRTAFARYAQVRLPRVQKLYKLSSGNARTYHAANGPSRIIRDIKLAIGSHFPMFARHTLDKVYGLDVTSR